MKYLSPRLLTPTNTYCLIFSLSCGIFPATSSLFGQVEGVFELNDVVEEVALADDDVEKAAEEQAVNLGFIVPEDNFDQWVFNSNGTVDKGGVKTRERLRALAGSRIEEINGMCSLTDVQKKKLELASRGDIVEIFDRVEAVRTKFRQIKNDQKNWTIHLMDFVDDFRYYRDPQVLNDPFTLSDERMDALLAATAEQLCHELKIEVPSWIRAVPAVRDPWFVSGMESLKAISLVESPLPFRLRKVFVMENFLSRV